MFFSMVIVSGVDGALICLGIYKGATSLVAYTFNSQILEAEKSKIKAMTNLVFACFHIQTSLMTLDKFL